MFWVQSSCTGDTLRPGHKADPFEILAAVPRSNRLGAKGRTTRASACGCAGVRVCERAGVRACGRTGVRERRRSCGPCARLLVFLPSFLLPSFF